MPGKYIEFIKAGRFAVPLELTFLPSVIVESSGKEVTTSKWIERHHWKEIKAMLKPAVESTLKHNEIGTLKINKTHTVSFGQDVCLGYMLQETKDNAPFLAVLDANKNCWTDDEDDGEVSALKDYGGCFKNYTTTKAHIVACVLKKTTSSTDDNKRVRKELGARSSDLTTYFEQSTSTANNPGPSSRNTHDRNAYSLGELSGASNEKSSCSNLSNRFDAYYTKAKLPKKTRYSKKPKAQFNSRNDTTWSASRSPLKTAANFWNKPYFDLEKEDNDDSLDSDTLLSSDATSNGSEDSYVFERQGSSETNDADADDDDDFSLPDIDTPILQPTPIKKPRTYKRKTAATTKVLKRSSVGSVLDIFGSSDSSSTCKTGALNKKQAVFGYNGFSNNTDKLSFEEALNASSYRKTVTRKVGQTSQLYSPSKANKKSQKCENSRMLSPTKKKPRNSPLSPPKRPASLYVQSYKTPLSVPSEQIRKVQSPTVGGSQFLSNMAKQYMSPTKESTSTINLNVLSPSISSVEVNTPIKNSNINSLSVLTAAAKKSFDEIQAAEEEKLRKRRGSLEDSTSSLLGVRAKKHPKKGQSFESPTKSRHSAVLSHENVPRANSHIEFDPEMPVLDKMVENDDDNPLTDNSSINQPELSKSPSPPRAVTITYPAPAQIIKPKKVKKGKLKQKNKSKSKADAATNFSNVGTSTSDVTSLHMDSRSRALISDVLANAGVREKVNADFVEARVDHMRRNSEISKEFEIQSNRSTLYAQVRHKDASTSTTTDAKLDEVEIEILRQTAVINYHVDAAEDSDTNAGPNFYTEVNGDAAKEEVPTPIPTTSAPVLPHELIYIDDDEEFFDKTIRPLCTPKAPERSYYMPAFGPTDEHCHKDLFCFNDRQPSNTGSSDTQLNSPNKVSQSTNTEDDETISMPPPTKRPPRSPKKAIDSANSLRVAPEVIPMDTNYTSDSENNVETVCTKILDNSDNLETDKDKPISTFKLLTNPSVLKQGMGYLTQLNLKKVNAVEVTKKLGITPAKAPNKDKEDSTLMPPPRPRRDLSPDICCLTSDSEIHQIRNSVRQSRATKRRLPGDSTTSDLDADLTPKVEVESDAEDTSAHEIVRELMNRCTSKSDDNQNNSQQTEDADLAHLSQRSACMVNFVPGYIQKSLLYKKNARLIQDMSLKELVENFNAVRSEIKGIYEGIVGSTRHTLYLQGLSKRKLLKELNVSLPFTSQQGMYLITYLYDYLFPDMNERLAFTEYVTFVGLPETFIRIYAKVTDQSYYMAEQEMRFGACYDENTLSET